MKRLVAYFTYDNNGSIKGVTCVLPNGIETKAKGAAPLPRLFHRLAGLGFGHWHITVIDANDVPVFNNAIGHGALTG